MIKNIFSCDGHLQITISPQPHITPGSDSGAIRWNSNSQGLEVYNGYSWVNISEQTVAVSLDSEIKSAVSWVKKKMHQETEANILAANNSSVRDALAQLTKAQEQLDIIVALVKNGNKEYV